MKKKLSLVYMWKKHLSFSSFLTVKCIIFLLFLNVFRLSANFSQGNTLNLTLDNTSIKGVLKEVEKQTEYTFLYDNSKVNVSRDVSVNFKDEKIETVLNKLFAGTDIIYRIEGKQIILGNRVENTKFQELTVSGKVVDLEHNEPMPGVTIMIKGTSKGTTTDMNGKFSLQVPDKNAILIFQFVGYLPEEITVGEQTVINVSLASDIQQLSEVVVIGYGTQKKKELTSAVSSVKSDDFNKGAITQSPLQAIQGKIPGLNISKGNGADPSANVQIQIRGVSSVTGTLEPFVVIDGVPGGNLGTVSPEDIESIDVLRDGSAAAIYGTRGTNGVILVTTKKGKSGKSTFDYSVYGYTERFAKKPKVLTADEYRAVTPAQPDWGSSTDWLEAISQTPYSQVHNFAVSGGNDQTTYYASINYRDLNGIIKRSYSKILNGRVSINTTGLKDKLNVQASISGTSKKYRPTDNNVYQNAFVMNPTAPVTVDSTGDYFEPGGFELLNPVMMINTAENDQKSTEMLSSMRATLEILPGLKFSAMGSEQHIDWTQGYYQYINRYDGSGNHGLASRADTNSTDRNFEATLNYSRQISGHSVNVMAGYSYEDQTVEGFGGQNTNFINDVFLYNNLNAGLQLNGNGQYNDQDVHSMKYSSILIAYFGRIMWSYNDKYMASISLRHEGSSKFGVNNRWGNFPAFSVGWRISKESFMKNIDWLSDLKLRGGYGVTGNQGVLPYQSILTYSSDNPIVWRGQNYAQVKANNNNNPDLKWEQKSEMNIGVDMGFLKNRVTANIDYYNRTTSDALWELIKGRPQYEADILWQNVGKITNKGIEIGINAQPVKRTKFTWNTNLNFSYNKNKVLSIANDNTIDGIKFENIGSPNLTGVYAFYLQNGQPIGNMYGFKFADVDSVGKWRFWDSTNTKKLYKEDVTEKDKRIIGNGLPKYWVGFSNTFTYGNFDLSITMRGAFGFNIFNVQRLYFENKKQLPRNVFEDALSSPVNDDPVYSDYYIEKGDYWKIDNITLGYNIPIKKKDLIQKARIYVSGSNMLTITNYKGPDPELQIEGFAPGIDRRASYPSTRIYTLGLNVIF